MASSTVSLLIPSLLPVWKLGIWSGLHVLFDTIMSAPHVFKDDFSPAPFFPLQLMGNRVRDNGRFEYRNQTEVCKVPRVESDAKLERIKLLRGEPGGNSSK